MNSKAVKYFEQELIQIQEEEEKVKNYIKFREAQIKNLEDIIDLHKAELESLEQKYEATLKIIEMYKGI